MHQVWKEHQEVTAGVGNREETIKAKAQISQGGKMREYVISGWRSLD